MRWIEMVGRILATFFYVILFTYGIMACSTLYWTLTGHCCGVPYLMAEWDKCLPAGDTMFPIKYFSSGHCDEKTWRRVK
jgi:hypothetical protein